MDKQHENYEMKRKTNFTILVKFIYQCIYILIKSCIDFMNIRIK